MHDGYQTSVDAALKIADLFLKKAMFLSLQTSSCSHKKICFFLPDSFILLYKACTDFSVAGLSAEYAVHHYIQKE